MQCSIKYVLWLAPTRCPNSFTLSAHQSTLLSAVVSIMLAKLYRSVLLSPHLAPGLTFIGNTTPGGNHSKLASVNKEKINMLKAS